MYTSRKLTAYEIYQLLYVDDGAFPFPTRDALTNGLTLVHSHLARFGLEVHIGRDGAPSKTECIFFPPPQFFDDLQYSDPALTTGYDEPWLLFDESPYTPPPTITAVQISSSRPTRKRKPKEKKETQESVRQKKIDFKYDALPETKPIPVADGHVTFCRTFKYLGSRISYNLRDDADIEVRLAAAGGIHILIPTASTFSSVQFQ